MKACGRVIEAGTASGAGTAICGVNKKTVLNIMFKFKRTTPRTSATVVFTTMQEGFRDIRLGHRSVEFPDNAITTSKYTAWNFVPKSLFLQFRRFANIWFLFQTLVMVAGEYSALYGTPFSPWSMIAMLVLVLGIVMVFEARDDLFRHSQDQLVNTRTATVLQREALPDPTLPAIQSLSDRPINWRSPPLKSLTIEWHQIRVGDLVLVRNGQPFPADLILITSSEAEGSCYIETSSIDGETNLKLRNAIPELANSLGNNLDAVLSRLSPCEGVAVVEDPNPSINHFAGQFRFGSPVSPALMTEPTNYLKSSHSFAQSHESTASQTATDVAGWTEKRPDPAPLTIKELLIRGGVLRNTGWIIGLTVYTGQQTKLIMNSRETATKMSRIDHVINSTLYAVVIAQCVLVSLATGFKTNWESSRNIVEEPEHYWYLFPPGSSPDEYILPAWMASWLTFFVLFNNFVPINLYAVMEFCHLLQALFINRDKEMYDHVTDTAARVRSQNLCQELGQIEWIFTDKTGTLTQNLMEFKCCAVGSRMYGSPTTKTAAKELQQALCEGPANPSSPSNFTNDHEALVLFLTVLSVAHTAIVQTQNDKTSFEGESPDEVALVAGAAAAGMQFVGRRRNLVMIQNGEVIRTFEVLAVNGFTSARKRMSVVVRDPDGQLLLLCKGADNVMIPLERRYGV
jgi:phospholipid-transporting ATPase